VPFFAFQFSKNWQLRPLFLAYFYLPNQNHETFINSHFQILEGAKIVQKTPIFRE